MNVGKKGTNEKVGQKGTNKKIIFKYAKVRWFNSMVLILTDVINIRLHLIVVSGVLNVGNKSILHSIYMSYMARRCCYHIEFVGDPACDNKFYIIS